MLKLRSTGSTSAANLGSDKQEDVRSFAGSAHEAIRSLVRRAIKSGDITQGPRRK